MTPRHRPSRDEQALLAALEGTDPAAWIDDALLDAYILGTLDPDTRSAFDEVLVQSLPLQARVASARRFADALGASGGASRVAARRPTVASAFATRLRQPRTWGALAAAAMLVIVVQQTASPPRAPIDRGATLALLPPLDDAGQRWVFAADGTVRDTRGVDAADRARVERFVRAALTGAPSPMTADSTRLQASAPTGLLIAAAVRWEAGNREGARVTLTPLATTSRLPLLQVVLDALR